MTTTPLPPPGWYADPWQPHAGLRWILPVGRTWQSITAGYVALFGLLLWPLGPVAMGLGFWGLSAAGDQGRGGRGRSVFAIGAGFLESLALVWLLAH